MRFIWDHAKNEANLRKHGIDFKDVENLFDHPRHEKQPSAKGGCMSKHSKTDWDRLQNMPDEDIDTSETPELDPSFFQNAELRIPSKQPVTLRIDTDVLLWFKSQGKGYQTRINKLLRSYMENQQS